MKMLLSITRNCLVETVHKKFCRVFSRRAGEIKAYLWRCIFLLVFLVSSPQSASAANCANCFEMVSDNKKYCDECGIKLSKDLSEQKAREELLVEILNSSRKNYRKALEDLSQFYLDVGFQNRLEKVRKELKDLNRMPEYEYLLTLEKPVAIRPVKNIEEANILFQDGMMYKKSLNLINKKSNLNTAVKRFKKILDFYPESDMADDAAFELAEIFEGFFFQDYEVAAAYYVKCFELNPETNNPARYMAANVYEENIKDYEKALYYYDLAAANCKDENLKEKARLKISELKKKGF